MRSVAVSGVLALSTQIHHIEANDDGEDYESLLAKSGDIASVYTAFNY